MQNIWVSISRDANCLPATTGDNPVLETTLRYCTSSTQLPPGSSQEGREGKPGPFYLQLKDLQLWGPPLHPIWELEKLVARNVFCLLISSSLPSILPIFTLSSCLFCIVRLWTGLTCLLAICKPLLEPFMAEEHSKDSLDKEQTLITM